MAITGYLGLNKADYGTLDWHNVLNDNFDLIDSGYENQRSVMPESYLLTDTFGGTAGVTVTLPKDAATVDEYSVTITPTTRTASIGDIEVEKSTSNFVVKSHDNNTADTFMAVVTYIGDVSEYGISIYHRWYVSPDTGITDHSNNATVGSLAWVLSQIGAASAYVEFPGNRTYSLTNSVDTTTSSSNIFLVFQAGALIKPAAAQNLRVLRPDRIIAPPTQQVIDTTNNSTNPIIFEEGGNVYPGWMGSATSTSIQIAIESLESIPASDGGNIMLTHDTYACTTQIDITESDISLIGAARGGVTLQRSGSADIAVMVDINGFKQIYNNKVMDIFFDCVSSAGFTGTNGFGLNIVDVAYGTFHNLRFSEFRCAPFLLQKSAALSIGHSVHNIVCTDIGDPDNSDGNDAPVGYEPDGVALLGTTSSNFSNIYIKDIGNVANGIMIFDGSTGNRFTNIYIDTTANTGIGFDGQNGTSANLTRNIFSNFYIYNTVKTGIWLLSNAPESADLAGNIFIGGVITGVTGVGFPTFGDGIRIESQDGTNKAYSLQFIGVEVINNAGYGIYNQNGESSIFKVRGSGNTKGMYYSTGTDVYDNTLEMPGELVSSAAPALQTWGYTRISSASNNVAATLADADQVGRRKTITVISYTNTLTVAVSNHVDGSPRTGTFTTTDQIWVLEWNGAKWFDIAATCALS